MAVLALAMRFPRRYHVYERAVRQIAGKPFRGGRDAQAGQRRQVGTFSHTCTS
jgi:hypothetical protein